MAVPRLIMLTNAKPGEAPTEYLSDRDRFPAEALFTTDLAKARAWQYPPGVRRWIRRNTPLLPILADCRRVWVNEDLVNLARKSDQAAAASTRSRRPATSTRATRATRAAGKTNPNKRPRPARTRGLKGKPAKRPATRAGRKPHRPAKAA